MNPRKYRLPLGGNVSSANPPDNFDDSKWLRSAEAAAYLRTSVGGIRNMVYRGQLRPRKPFGRLLFKRTDLDRVIETSAKGSS